MENPSVAARRVRGGPPPKPLTTMPIYDFACPRCGHREEVLILPGDNGEVPRCPKCGTPMKRVFSGSVGLVFKGSGFYITDYKNKSSSPSSQKEPSEKSSSGSKESDAS